MQIVLLGQTVPEGQKIYVTEAELKDVSVVYYHGEIEANFIIYKDMFLLQISENIVDNIIKQSCVVDCTRMSNFAFFESFSSYGDHLEFLIPDTSAYHVFETSDIEESLKQCYINEKISVTDEPLDITCFYHPGVGFINDALGHTHLIQKLHRYTPEFIIHGYSDVESFKMYLNEFLNIQSFPSVRSNEYVHLELYTLNSTIRKDIEKIFKHVNALVITQHFLNDFDNILKITHVSDLNKLKDADKLPEFFITRKPRS